MNDEMKLKIAKLEADGYKVEVITNNNTEKWNEYIIRYKSMAANLAMFGVTPPCPKHPFSFITTEFKITKSPD